MMKLVKPFWINHKANPIYSLDLHPDGTRLATAGNVDDGGCIYVWNMDPVRNESDENTKTCSKLLCRMEQHIGCVNAVRWAPLTGKFLASGSDDNLVMIWGLEKELVNHKYPENWVCVHTLRAHTGDVLNVEWSQNECYVASCSIDSTIVVWNALKLPDIVTIIRGHTSFVKGICWDPAVRYLASQSDDKTIRIWRTSDWKEEKCISEPFEECDSYTHVLRLHWSPDGQQLVSAHAVNNNLPTAQIVLRKNWQSDMNFVGHTKAISVVKFNPKILQTNNNPQRRHCCVATAGRDRCITVWVTYMKRPLIVLRDLFLSTVVDIAWNSNGEELMACSIDGTVCYLKFNEDELGKPLSDKDMKTFIEDRFGIITGEMDKTNNADVIFGPGNELRFLELKRKNKCSSEPQQIKVKRLLNPLPSNSTKSPENKSHSNTTKVQPNEKKTITNNNNSTSNNQKSSINNTECNHSSSSSGLLGSQTQNIPKLLTYQVEGTDLVINARNFAEIDSDLKVSVARCLSVKDNSEHWRIGIDSVVIKISASSYIVVFACDDFSVHAFSLCGGFRLHSPFVFSTSIAIIRTVKWNLLLLTNDHRCYLWELAPGKVSCIFSEVRLPQMRGHNLIKVALTDDIVAILLYSNLRMYAYSVNARCWIKYVVPRQLKNKRFSLIDLKVPLTDGILSKMFDLFYETEKSKYEAVFDFNDELSRLLTFSEIESQIVAAVELKSSVDFEIWLLCALRYLKHFTDTVSSSQLNKIFTFLSTEIVSSLYSKTLPSPEFIRSLKTIIQSNEKFLVLNDTALKKYFSEN